MRETNASRAKKGKHLNFVKFSFENVNVLLVELYKKCKGSLIH